MAVTFPTRKKSYIIEYGISGNNPCICGCKKKLEIVKATPWAPPYSFLKIQFLKRNYNPEHWEVIVYNHIDEAWQCHQIKWQYSFPADFFPGWFCSTCCRCFPLTHSLLSTPFPFLPFSEPAGYPPGSL